MSEYQPIRRGGPALHPAEVAREFLVGRATWGEDVEAALSREAEAKAWEHTQARLTAMGRTEALAEWKAARKAWDQNQAETVSPLDFQEFPEPEVPVDVLAERSRLYREARTRAGRSVTSAALDNLAHVWATLENAWSHSVAPSIDPEVATIAEAAAIEATSEAARKALASVGLWLALAQGASGSERKLIQKAAKASPPVLLSLEGARDILSGRQEARAAAEATKAAAAAAKAENIKTGAQAAKARNPQPSEG